MNNSSNNAAERSKDIESDIATREEVLKCVTRILRGIPREVDGRLIVPTDANIIEAATLLAYIFGWFATAKTEVNITLSKAGF